MKPDGNILILEASEIDPLASRVMEEIGLPRDGIEQRILDWLRDPDVGLVGARR